VQRENIYYDISQSPYAKRGADTITYTYDNTPWFPEAANLYEITDVKTGKQNANNVIAIQLKKFDGTGGINDYYKSMQYTYTVKGKRLAKANMVGSTVKGSNVKQTFEFAYKCD
jgi:hypothetical protein